MKRLSVFLLLFGFLEASLAVPEQDLHQGDQLAQELLGTLKIQQPKDHAFYKGMPSESSSGVESKAETIARHSPAAKMIRDSSQSRPQFKINPEKDPLLLGGEKLMANPLNTIGGKDTRVSQTTQTSQDEVLRCEEPGDESEETCTRTLHVRVERTKVQKDWQGWFHLGKCSAQEEHGHPLHCHALRNAFRQASDGAEWWWFWSHPPDTKALFNITAPYKACVNELAGRTLSCGGGCKEEMLQPPCSADKIKKVVLLPHPQNSSSPLMAAEHFWIYGSGRTEWYYQPLVKVTYEEEGHKVLPDEWGSTCSFLEERADQGLCSYTSKVCTQGPETRIISGVPVTKKCWQETYTYHCSYPAKNTCGPLKARGCVQIKSECKKRVGKACVVYTQTYQCKGSSATRTQITGGKKPFCLDGNCRDQGFDLNDEMMSSLAQLSLLKEIQGKFDGLLFKGSDNRCSKATLSFKDCCGSGKGWGMRIGLAECSGEEEALQLKRQKGLCHFIGTYCSQREKITRICLQKKSTYCCFGSKLLKIFHEQGRSQIGLNWGSPQEPVCRGFTVEELQRIDFSRLDLREVFEEVMTSFQPRKLENINQKLKDRLKTLQEMRTPKKGMSIKQRGEA